MVRAHASLLAAIAAMLTLAAPVPADTGHGHGHGGVPAAGAPGHSPGVDQAASLVSPAATEPSVAPTVAAGGHKKGTAARSSETSAKALAQPTHGGGRQTSAEGNTRGRAGGAAVHHGSGVRAVSAPGVQESPALAPTTAAAPPAASVTTVPAAVATSVGEPIAVAPPIGSPVATAPGATRSRRPATGRFVLVRRRAARRTVAAAPAGNPATTSSLTAPLALAAGSLGADSAAPIVTATAPRAPEPSSPLVRTVERILEVIPGWVGITLAALAAGGLLLGTAALRQTLRARRLERDRRRLVADVGLLQSALLPAVPEQVGRARVTTAYRPAEGLAAGGDFFDVFALSGGRTAVILGDMAGHGREIVPFTALVRYSLRAYLEAGLVPRAALQVASSVLESQLGGHMVAATVAVFDPEAGLLTYACAGQAQPLLGPSAPQPVTATSSAPIGAGVITGRRQTTVGLPAGSAACFYTDGVADVRVDDHRLGTEALAARFDALGASTSADELLRAVVRGSDAQPDDMAVCLLAPLPGAADPRPGVVEELELDAEMLADGRAARFLAACGVAPAGTAAAERSAAEMVSRRGSAVLVVRRSEAGASVRVDRPLTAMLPAARRARPGRTMAMAG